jgi:metal-responsive CopG/Arc/MetJ family transcriptional regulator
MANETKEIKLNDDSKVISLYVNDDLLQWIDKTAKKEERSRNNFLVKVLKEKKNQDRIE